MHIGYVIALQALYGTTLTASKIIVSLCSPCLLIGIRMTIAGLVLLLYKSLINHKSLYLPRSIWLNLTQLAIFNIYLPYVLRYWAIQYLSVSSTALFFNLTPLFCYLIAYSLGMQKQSLKRWIGLIVSVTGLLPMIICNQGVVNGCKLVSQNLFLPELAMLGAVLSLSYGWIVMQRTVQQNASPIIANGISMLLGGFLSLGTSLAIGENTAITAPYTLFSWLSFIIIVTNFICYNAQAMLLKYFNATTVALASLAAPLFATITSVILLGETIHWSFYLSASMLALGIYIFYQADKLDTAMIAEEL